MTSPGPVLSPLLRRCASALLLSTLAGVGAASASAATVSAAPAPSAAAASALDEGRQIAAERAAVQAEFVARERECREHFVVTPCLDRAKADRRQALDKLRARQIALDEARRHERSNLRRAELQEKAAEDARRESARAAQPAASSAPLQPPLGRPLESNPPGNASSAVSEPHRGSHGSATVAGKHPPPREPQAARARREAASRAAFEARKAQAEEHREEALDRISKRAGQKPPAASLPVPPPPSAASSPARSASRP